MEKAYIQFEAPRHLAPNKKRNIFFRAITRILPMANPDVDRRIDDVKTWLVECDLATGVPEREIGLDAGGKVIVKMPNRRNYGYWTDNNLLLEDFRSHFTTSPIAQEKFNAYWEK
jgi:hypothetical protein